MLWFTWSKACWATKNLLCSKSTCKAGQTLLQSTRATQSIIETCSVPAESLIFIWELWLCTQAAPGYSCAHTGSEAPPKSHLHTAWLCWAKAGSFYLGNELLPRSLSGCVLVYGVCRARGVRRVFLEKCFVFVVILSTPVTAKDVNQATPLIIKSVWSFSWVHTDLRIVWVLLLEPLLLSHEKPNIQLNRRMIIFGLKYLCSLALYALWDWKDVAWWVPVI